MRLSLTWLRELVHLPEPAATVADLLTAHAFETVVLPAAPRASLKNIRVGEVVAIEKHPHADRLSLVTVHVGRARLRVVCGAPNVRVGLRVAVAFPGATLLTAEGTRETLQPTTIRGVRSEAMLCSERELGFGNEHGGILELPPDAPLGAPLERLFPDDAILDADVLPDRASDCSSHLGVARELGAILRREVPVPAGIGKPFTRRTAPTFRVIVDNPALCRRYVAVVLEGVRPIPSPLWVQQRLRAVGVRPQNLLVDVTNYVTWEIGQPTHAFDARTIGHTLAVRPARKNEQMVTLDGVTRELPAGTLVIAADKEPLAIAGILGGLQSGVREDTTAVVLEAALFDGATVRKTAQTLGLRTDASDRFSRGLTAWHVSAGAARVIELLTSLCGARVTAVFDSAPRIPSSRAISVNHTFLEGILGMRVAQRMVQTSFAALGCAVHETEGVYRVTPPPYRPDLTLPENLADEVGRLQGYDHLPSPLPLAPMIPAVLPRELEDVRRIQDALKGAGWMEVYTVSFMEETEARALHLDAILHLRIVNPVNEAQHRLRTSLLPNLLHLASAAVKQEPLTRVFEVGRVYPVAEEEQLHLAGVIVRRGERVAEDFYEMKGAVEHVLQTLEISDVWFDLTDPTPQEIFLTAWEPGVAAEVKSDAAELGFVGAIAASVLETVRVRGSVVAFELNLSRVQQLERIARVYQQPPPYPLVQRDVSLRVPEGVLVDELREAIGRAGGALVQDVQFVDQYADPSGTRGGVTLRVIYGSSERTLRDAEVNALHVSIIEKIHDALGVEER